MELDPIVRPSLAGGTGNPDGLHWSWEVHRLVGAATADALVSSGFPASAVR